MEEKTLAALLEEDKEQVLENIARDRTVDAARTAAEKELDRLLYRYSEGAQSEELSLGAQTALQTLRCALPLLDSVDEVRQWQRSVQPGAKKPRVRPLGLIMAAAGLVLVLASVLVLLKRTEGALTLAVLLPPLLGALCLFGGGLFLRPGKKAAAAQEPERKQEFLVDAGGVYRTLRCALLLADKHLQELQERRELAEAAPDAGEEALSAREAELFAALLENAYARRGEDDAEELIGSIRFYLHGKNVDTIDYTKEKQSWFELLPARGQNTMRPALVSGGRLIKKGLASVAEG